MQREFTIYDGVVGQVKLKAYERQLIDSPTFQRLRKLTHLGLASIVFPNANHTRFSHSLGTLHIMSRFCDKLEIKDDAPLLRAAALLHDVGHFPFSHVTEQAFKMRPNRADKPSISDEFPDSEASGDFSDAELLQQAAGGKELERTSYNHEDLGKTVIQERDDIRKILENNGLDPEEVGLIITGEFAKHSQKRMYSLLMNSDFDVDKIDYLLRDSTTIGTTYGSIDLEYLLKTLTYRDVDYGGIKDCRVPAFKYKGLSAIDHFFLGRYFMYQAIIFHKTVACYEIMAKALILGVMRDNVVPCKTFGDIENIVNSEDFVLFDDTFIINGINELRNSKSGFLKKLSGLFLSRSHPKLAYEVMVFGDSTDRRYDKVLDAIKNNKDDICKEAKIAEPEFTFYQELKRPIYKGNSRNYNVATDALPPDAEVFIIDPIYDRVKPLESENSSLMHQLGGKELKIIRIYTLDDGTEKGPRVRLHNVINGCCGHKGAVHAGKT